MSRLSQPADPEAGGAIPTAALPERIAVPPIPPPEEVDPLLASVAHGYNLAVHRDFRHNAVITTFWQFLWGLGIAFCMWTTTAPAYLGHLGVSRTTLGMVMALPWVCVPLQIVSSVWFGGKRRRLYLMISYMLATLPWLAYAVAMLLFGEHLGPTVRTAWFIGASLFFTAGLACGVPLFFELLTDNTPLLHRGGMAGYRSGAIGVAGLLAGLAARAITQRWPEPTNYHINFAIGLSIWFASCLVMLAVRDHVDPRRLLGRPDSRDVLRRFRQTAGELWRDVNSRMYLFFHGVLAVALVFSPIIIDAAGRQLGATPAQQQMFTTVYLISIIGPAWLLGRLADRCGYRLVAGIIALLVMLGFALTLSSSSLVVWYISYGLCGLAANLASTVLGNMCVELLPRHEPSLLLSTATTLFLPLVMLGVVLGGRLGDSQGSYLFVFALGTSLAAIAALGFLLLVTEPRRGRLYVVRVTGQA